VKFTPDGGRVDLAARLVGDEIHVAVRDTGIGIAPQDQVRIFEDFQQVGRDSTASHEGTGLGLALARRFVELHGGRLWVDSQVGVGSTFTFSLPVRRPVSTEAEPSREAGQPEAIAPLARGPGQPVTTGRSAGLVLLVEDNPQSIDLLSLYLRADGFEVAVASDGEEALALARQLQPAAIVLDILLPRLDGWDVLARAKADPSLAHIPVIIVSMLDERGKGFALGAAEYLVKPVSRDEVISALHRVRLPDPLVHGAARVLAIDDDPMALELIEAILRPEGYMILKATGGAEGITLARQELPALVILDLLMPDVDGFGVVEQLWADPATARIPIVLLTSRSMTTQDKQRLNGHISYLARKGEFNRAAFVELVSTLCPIAIG
jgi:CheY-like chemotaxis protein